MERVQNGSFLNPYCHLLIKGVRVDSPPAYGERSFAETLVEYQRTFKLTREALATELGVSLGTLKNWKHGRAQPRRAFWKQIRKLGDGHLLHG